VVVIQPFKDVQEGYGYYYLDDHMNGLGHKLVAKSIIKELRRK